MAKTGDRENLGIYISPKEIVIAQVKLVKGSRPEAEHLLTIPTEFPAKGGMQRPLSLNQEFFSEKAAWVAPFKQAVKKISWDSSSVVVSLAPQFAILRYFVMPAVDRRFWNKSIPLESKKYIPVSFEEVVYDFNATPADGGKKLGVLFGLTQRKSVEFLTETLKAVGLTMAALETTPISLERYFALLDPKEHDSKGYVHFGGNSVYMLFSHGGQPVLFRETEGDSGGSMSDRKRLDIKGAVQFVDRYVGGKDYKAVMLSGEGAEAWQAAAEKEAAPIPVEKWDPSALGALNDNGVPALLACAAALRGRVAGAPLPDISGISTAANLEKSVQGYVWNVTILLGVLLLLLSAVAQTRLFVVGATISSLKSKVANVPELDGMESSAISALINTMQSNTRVLEALVTDIDPLAPKLAAIADNIPSQLWLVSVAYSNPFALGEAQTGAKELTLVGETLLRGDAKANTVGAFTRAIKAAEEFKIYSPPFGSVDSTTEGGSAGQADPSALPEGPKPTGFSVRCTFKRK